jgi:hypothetical protein
MVVVKWGELDFMNKIWEGKRELDFMNKIWKRIMSVLGQFLCMLNSKFI